VTEAPELNADIEEADLRTVLHALHATKKWIRKAGSAIHPIFVLLE